MPLVYYDGQPLPILKFNTGRHYTVYGQRIWAVRTPEGRVVMYDHDRMLNYVLDCPFTQEDIMKHYDKCWYEDPLPSEIAVGQLLEDKARREYND